MSDTGRSNTRLAHTFYERNRASNRPAACKCVINCPLGQESSFNMLLKA